MGADTRANTASGGGAPQVGDLRLLEDGGERGGALGSDAVASETASEGWGGDGERVGVSMGVDTFTNTIGSRFEARAHFRPVTFVSLRTEARTLAPWSLMLLCSRLRARGGDGERVGVSTGTDCDTKAITLGLQRT